MIDVKVVGLDMATSLIENMDIQQFASDLVEELAKEGVALAKDNLRSQHFTNYPSELEQSVQYVVNRNQKPARATISADAGFAAYVEYGTGIVGKNSPSPSASIKGIVYDRNNHGDGGWVYFKNGKFRWTKGQTSKPFMYETAQQLTELIPSVAERLLKKRFGKRKNLLERLRGKR